MENFRLIDFHRQRDFGDKIGATFEFVRQNFKSFFKALLFIAGPPILISSALQAMFYMKFMANMLGVYYVGDPEAMTDFMGSSDFWLGVSVFVLLLSFGAVIMVSVTYNYMLEYEQKKTNKIETGAVWDRVKNTILMYFGTFLLNAVAILLAFFVFFFVLGLFMQVAGFLGVIIGIAGFLGFYYVIVTIALIFIVRANEPIGYFEAVSRCFYLIRGKWWSTFGLLFVLAILQTIINYILYLPFSIANLVAGLHDLDNDAFADPTTTQNIGNNILLMCNFFTGFLLSTLSTIAIAFQYFNLVERKEAKGLLSKIDSIGQQTTAPRDEHY